MAAATVVVGQTGAGPTRRARIVGALNHRVGLVRDDLAQDGRVLDGLGAGHRRLFCRQPSPERIRAPPSAAAAPGVSPPRATSPSPQKYICDHGGGIQYVIYTDEFDASGVPVQGSLRDLLYTGYLAYKN